MWLHATHSDIGKFSPEGETLSCWYTVGEQERNPAGDQPRGDGEWALPLLALQKSLMEVRSSRFLCCVHDLAIGIQLHKCD